MNNKTLFWLGAGVAVVAILASRQAAASVGDAIDPSSTENIFIRGVHQVGDILNDGQDDNDFNLGRAISELFHGPAPL